MSTFRDLGRLKALIAGVALAGSSHPPLVAQGRDFEPNHIRMSGTVPFEATPEDVYALLAPDGQQALTRTWDIDILSPPSGAAEPGATFTTLRAATGGWVNRCVNVSGGILPLLG